MERLKTTLLFSTYHKARQSIVEKVQAANSFAIGMDISDNSCIAPLLRIGVVVDNKRYL